MSSGIMIAVPEAWTTRPTTRNQRLGAMRGKERAGREQRHREDEDRPGVHALQQEAGDRDDHRHGEQERRGQPLRVASPERSAPP